MTCSSYRGTCAVTWAQGTCSTGAGPVATTAAYLRARRCRCCVRRPEYNNNLRSYSVGLNQSSWVHSKNGSAVYKDALVRCLQGLTGMRVRGGMFAGAETAVLLLVEWVEGANAWLAAASTNTAFTQPRPVPVVVPRSCQTGDVYKIVSTSTVSPSRIQFGNVPRICSAATLKLSILQLGVSGVLAAVGDRSIVVCVTPFPHCLFVTSCAGTTTSACPSARYSIKWGTGARAPLPTTACRATTSS